MRREGLDGDTQQEAKDVSEEGEGEICGIDKGSKQGDPELMMLVGSAA